VTFRVIKVTLPFPQLIKEQEMAEQATPIEAAARMSRRHLLAALTIVGMLGLAALLSFTTAGGDAGKILWQVMPVMIAVTAASLYRSYKRVDIRALKTVRNDELRQASLSRAWRNGFFAVLGLQPMLALGLGWSGAANAAALMAAASATIGAATVLASLLWYDR
jgi:O-antigen/teichoic acid export membrane protein